jgi:hypothetical protein
MAAALSILVPAGSALAQQQKLTPLAFRNLVKRTRGSLVRVVSQPQGTAVLVGVGGEILAPDRLVRDGALVVEHKGERLKAKLLRRDADLGLAMLVLASGSYPAATIGSAARLKAGDALVGLSFDGRGELATTAGHFDRASKLKGGMTSLRCDLRCSADAVLFNSRGELVGLRVARKRSAFPIDEIRARLSGAAQ